MSDLFKTWNETKEALTQGLDSQRASIVQTVLDNQAAFLKAGDKEREQKLKERLEEQLKIDLSEASSWWDEAVAKYKHEHGDADLEPTEDTVNQFQKILIPMIRRIVPTTIANEIVGVQPMQAPGGLIYSMKFNTETHDGDAETKLP